MIGISRGEYCTVSGTASVLLILHFTDAVEKQTRFVDQHKLNYRILSDADGSARKSYSVSKAALGLIDGKSLRVFDDSRHSSPARPLGRETFFIGKDGIVKDVCDKMVDWKCVSCFFKLQRSSLGLIRILSSHTRMVEKQLKLTATPTATSTAPAPAAST